MTVTPVRKFKLATDVPDMEGLKDKNRFLELYLQVRDEIVDGGFYARPDPVMVLVYYLRRYSEVRQPRAIHRLIEVSLDRVLDRLSKLGFMELPDKGHSVFKPAVQKKLVEAEAFEESEPEPRVTQPTEKIEPDTDNKLDQFMVQV